MKILWDKEKSGRLKEQRGVSLEEVSELILQGKYIDILKHPKRSGQFIFVIPIRGYIHVVPFVVDSENNIILKTVFPSRKFQTKYGVNNT